MARGLCNFNDTEIGKVFRAITELIYDGKEPQLPDKLVGYYYAIKPYLEDDTERHLKYIEGKSKGGIESGKTRKQKASIIGKNNNPSNGTEGTKPTEGTTDNDNDIYTSNMLLYNNIDKEKFKKEFPEKNIDVEIQKMCNNRAGRNKQIKKPVQALRNRLLPKKRDKEYCEGVLEKTDDQRITEFLASKSKFGEKYGEQKYDEVKEMRVKQCLKQPLSLV